MKFVFTKHVLKDKLPAIKRFDWHITRTKIKNTVRNPSWRGVTKRGQETAMGIVDKKHILRVVFRREDDIFSFNSSLQLSLNDYVLKILSKNCKLKYFEYNYSYNSSYCKEG